MDNVRVDNSEYNPFEISQYQQQVILQALEAKDVGRPCYRCGNTSHTLHNSLTTLQLQAGTNANVFVGGPAVPAAIIFCSNCGVISLHALGALGLLNHPAFPSEAHVPS